MSIEKKYQRLTDTEHVLLRPGMYIGSIKPHTEEVFLVDKAEGEKFKLQEVTYNPGFLKLFDEIVSNSVDEHKRTPSLNKIEVTVNRETGWIYVKDNGGIPVQMHKEYNEWVPEMIFSNLKTGSNFDDSEDRIVVGTNGVGSTLTNIFSKTFTVITCDGKNKFEQTFSDNMSKRTTPKITKAKQNFTEISWLTDFERFGMLGIDDESFKMIQKRLYDISACNLSVKIYLNGELINFKSFSQYAEMYTSNILFEQSPNWKIGIGHSTTGFRAVSFVNSVETKDGGTHVNSISGQIVHALREMIKKKHRVDVKPNEIKNHLFLFIDCTIVNPAFSSQTKEKLITEPKDFGSTHEISEKTLKKIFTSEIIESILDWIEKKKAAEERAKLRKLNNGLDKTKVIKLVDAKKSGNRDSCTLAIFEGDCLHEDTEVICMNENDGLISKAIKNINIGDYVITHNNSIKKVTNKSTKIQKLVNINAGGTIIRASLNHRFLMYDTISDTYAWVVVSEFIGNINRYKFVKNKLSNISHSKQIEHIEIVNDLYVITLDDYILKSTPDHKFLTYDLNNQCFALTKSTELNINIHLIIFTR